MLQILLQLRGINLSMAQLMTKLLKKFTKIVCHMTDRLDLERV
ncbi:hypothetical protein EVA_17895 [gut metagenome]|uniref:Uncharacterized protein n=1 Tax=gut metagenome TaxID=749906 RepID=J9FWQ1_9ZZZZ